MLEHLRPSLAAAALLGLGLSACAHKKNARLNCTEYQPVCIIDGTKVCDTGPDGCKRCSCEPSGQEDPRFPGQTLP